MKEVEFSVPGKYVILKTSTLGCKLGRGEERRGGGWNQVDTVDCLRGRGQGQGRGQGRERERRTGTGMRAGTKSNSWFLSWIMDRRIIGWVEWQ